MPRKKYKPSPPTKYMHYYVVGGGGDEIARDIAVAEDQATAANTRSSDEDYTSKCLR